MTTKTNITLPPLPGALVDVETEARAYARAAVEADRQAWMMPSDDDVATACKSLGWDLDAQEETDMILLVRTVMSRYSSGHPAAVRCNHCGWHGADADLVRDVAADEPEDGAADVCPQCKRIGDLQDIGQHAASAEPKWAYDKIDRFLRNSLGDDDYAEYSAALDALADDYDAAPVAQEPVVPVAEVLSSRKGNDTSTIDKALPAGTKIYVVASDCSRATQDDESLADTQRAIIEAAERRGYERAIAECAQVARAAKGADHG